MTKLDDLFQRQTDSLMHPRLRDWKEWLEKAGTQATLEVDWPGPEFGLSQPEMHLQFTENGHQLPLETVPWDDDLNTGLIRLGVRAANSEKKRRGSHSGCARRCERRSGSLGMVISMRCWSNFSRKPT